MEGEKDDEKTEKESEKGGLAISVLPVSHPISLPGDIDPGFPNIPIFFTENKILSRFDSIFIASRISLAFSSALKSFYHRENHGAPLIAEAATTFCRAYW